MQSHVSARFTAHALNRLCDRQTFHRHGVNFGDQVIGHQTCSSSWRVFNGGDNLDQAVFHGDFNAYANECARRALTEFFPSLLVVVGRVRVKVGDHARDGIGDKFFLVGGLNIITFDHAEHGGQLLQLFQGQWRHVVARNRLQLHGG